jgi:excisionase family DNA binding protein
MTFGQKSITQIHKKEYVMDEILKRLEIIERHLIEQNLILKNVLSFNEACHYLELSHSHLYKLTSAGNIPFYKPNGKKLYFNRVELDEWLLRNRSAATSEIEDLVNNFKLNEGRAER